MLIALIAQLVITGLNVIFSILGHVATLPFGIDSAVSTMMGAWYGFLGDFWPLQFPWTLFCWYVGIAFTLWIIEQLVRLITTLASLKPF